MFEAIIAFFCPIGLVTPFLLIVFLENGFTVFVQNFLGGIHHVAHLTGFEVFLLSDTHNDLHKLATESDNYRIMPRSGIRILPFWLPLTVAVHLRTISASYRFSSMKLQASQNSLNEKD